MKNFPKYGSIENLYRCTEILQHECVATEKIHGTNVRVMWSPDNGGLVLGSRNNTIYKAGEATGLDGYGFAIFMENHPSLNFFHDSGECDDYVFYGEFHGSNIQKGVKYCEEKDFRVFDIRNPEGNFLDWYDVVATCNKVGFKFVPVIDIGIFDIAYLDDLRDRKSLVGAENGFNSDDNIGEGIVLKPVRTVLDKFGNRMIAKYKSDKWAENAKAPKTKTVNPDKIELQAKADEFARTVVTPGRVATIIEHLTREGNTELSMTRTGEFLREFIKDIMEEYKEFYSTIDRVEQNTYNKAVNSLASVAWKKEVMTVK